MLAELRRRGARVYVADGILITSGPAEVLDDKKISRAAEGYWRELRGILAAEVSNDPH